MAAIHDRIIEHFKLDHWEQTDVRESDGVCIYSIYKDGKLLATDTLLGLDGKTNDK